MNIEHKPFPNYGYSMTTMPSDILDSIREEVVSIQQTISTRDKINKNLAGHLEYQFYLEKSQALLSPIILEMASEYVAAWNYSHEIFKNTPVINPISFKLDPIWCNFQKKSEYNPLHDHTGIFSFVAWINIPYDMHDEMNMPNVVTSNGPLATTFNFLYTNVFGEIVALPFFAEKKHEGTIIFFPSRLKHLVYPFLTSDDYRVTISGNIVLADQV